jgi:hypothetical protein
MCQPVPCDRIFERLRDVRLADKVVEGLGSIFARENLVAHALTLSRSQRRERSKEVDAASSRVFLLNEAAGKPLLLGVHSTRTRSIASAGSGTLLRDLQHVTQQ